MKCVGEPNALPNAAAAADVEPAAAAAEVDAEQVAEPGVDGAANAAVGLESALIEAEEAEDGANRSNKCSL